MEDKANTVAGKYKGDLQRGRIVERLLHSVTIGEFAFFGLDQCDGNVLVIQHEVCLFCLASANQFAAHNDAPLGEENLSTNLCFFIPSRLVQGWGYEFDADVVFAEMVFVHFTQG